MMTKKNYIEFAKALAELRDACTAGSQHELLDEMIEGIADIMSADNPNFDRDRFNTAARRGDWVAASTHR